MTVDSFFLFFNKEEEFGAMREMGKHQAKFEKLKENKRKSTWPADVSIKEYLEHMNVTKSWE